jgi:integrase/recombinase XerD
LRLGEVAGLTWREVDLDHWQLRLIGKGGKFRLVPLHPILQDVLREYRQRAHPRQEHLLATISRERLSAPTLGRAVRALTDRADVSINSPSHAFRRTVATVMYEHGVRTRVIERIMGWAPRTMHDRHYLRVCDEPMHQAIQTLYDKDPICDRQRAALTLTALPTRNVEPSAWLADETAHLDEFERRLGLRAS